MKVQQDAENIILLVQTEKNKDVYKDEDIPVLTVPQLKFLYMWKCGKGPSAGTNKPELVSAWMRTKHSQPMHDFSCTAVYDETLKSLELNEIELKTTELGRQTQSLFNDSVSALATNLATGEICREQIHQNVSPEHIELLKNALM